MAKPIILFDGGYLFFYRYHATMKHLKLKLEESPTPEQIKIAYLDHLDKQLAKTKKKFKSEKLYFCMDISLKNIWRTELYPEYKGTRENNPKIMNDIPDIRNEINEILDKYCVKLTHPKMEADDVIYMCVKLIDKSIPIIIISNDNDYLQLKKNPNVSIMTGGLKEIKGTGDPIKDLWTKILMGDKSDNINKLLTKSKAMKKIELGEKALLEEYGDTLNYKLICMDMIPQKLQNEFTKMYKL